MDGDVNLQELFDFLEKILPNGEWKSFSLESNVVINNWHSPIIIEKSYPYPYRQPWICESGDSNKMFCINEGVYNLEAKSL